MKSLLFILCCSFCISSYAQITFYSDAAYKADWNNQTEQWVFSKTDTVNSVIHIADSHLYVNDMINPFITSITTPNRDDSKKGYTCDSWDCISATNETAVISITTYDSARTILTICFTDRYYAYYLNRFDSKNKTWFYDRTQ